MSAARFRVQEHAIPTCHIREFPNALAHGQEDVLQLAVKQYTPLDNLAPKVGDITIIGAHANGFPKELYEPLWDELYARLKAKHINIRNVFIADVAWQGQSGVLNEDKLGNEPGWLDHSRDLLLMVNHFRHDIRRPIFAIGHSMGGAHLLNLSHMHPRLFTSMIMIDAVAARESSREGNFNPARASTKRRDRWPSRKAAEIAFKKSKFYQTWDPRVLDCWIKHGLRDLPTKIYPDAKTTSSAPPTLSADVSTTNAAPDKDTEREVTLTTTKHQEVLTFLRGNYPTADNPDPWTNPNRAINPDVDLLGGTIVPYYRGEPGTVFSRLPSIRPSLLWVFGEDSYLCTPLTMADKMANTGTGVGGSGGVKAGRVDSVLLKGVGHLIPMEDVDGCADACAAWIQPELARWREQEARHQKAWDAIPRNQKGLMPQEYVDVMNSDWSQFEKKPSNGGSKL